MAAPFQNPVALAVLVAVLGACATPLPPGEVGAEWRAPSVRLDLDLLPSLHGYVHGTVAGQQTAMLVDSGAGIIVLSRSFADRIGARGSGRLSVSGAGGKTIGQVTEGLTIRLGDFAMHGVAALVLDLREVEERLGRPIPVILGRGLFESAVVEIDYANRALTCHRPASFRYDGPGHTAALRTHGSGLKLVECQVEDLPPAWFQLDTGSGNTVDLFAAYTEEHGLLAARPLRSQRLDGGVGGFAPAPVASLQSFGFAGHTLHDVPASFPAPAAGSFATGRFAGNLGAGVLSRFRVWIDFRGNRMHVEPGKDLRDEFPRDRLGLHTRPRDTGVEVVYVSPGSPAEAGGITAGMRFVALDGTRQEGAGLVELLRAAAQRPAGTRLVLLDEAGRGHAVVLARYY